MNNNERMKLEEITIKILEYANSKPNPQEAITDFLISVSLNSMLAEREQWELACNNLENCLKDQIIKARFQDGNNS